MSIKSKLPNVGETIFTVMSRLAIDHNAINLGQGFPDFETDRGLIDSVHQAMLEGHNQYAPMSGHPLLKSAIATKTKTLYGASYDTDYELTVTNGASQALMAAILALVHPGDEVIVIEPFYDLYLPCIELAGGFAVIVPMVAPKSPVDSYYIDWEAVEKVISSKTRLLILNFPHNPTGIRLKPQDLDALEHLVHNFGITLLSDEVYEHLIFDNHPHLSLSTRESLRENSIIVSSFGKTFSATGWKLGYCLAPAKFSKEIQKVHQYMVFCVATPMQVGLARYMEDSATYNDLAKFYQKKRDYLFNGLLNTAFEPMQSEGTFFLLASYQGLSTKNEIEFSQWLTQEHGVGVIPVSAFYQDPKSVAANHQLVRFCFAKQDHTLARAIERLEKISR
ncbi:methionine aminotransferase [Paenalcaligenes niemegkensis]|uniref:methionine aminotransferase n=1 Tax=Paenalcaligenes niemegkensis TaxID=2895469 RepID=UPI001EE79808|nr:methionine aminotransferase [Paenalcaligenes niemegkensis]MCQ9617831.1 methionine aminotransferase [Paenalcaligenes niemegkensis]